MTSRASNLNPGSGRSLPGSTAPGAGPIRGRVADPPTRHEAIRAEAFGEGWEADEAAALRIEVTEERPRTIITRNDSPDIAFDRSVSPYRDIERGFTNGLSSGLEQETRLFARPSAPELLERELRAPGYRPAAIALGSETDPYQPIERRYRITRAVIDVLRRFNHPVGIVTRSGLVARDIDLLAPMADRQLAKVAIPLATLDPELARRLEPRAPSPARRLAAIRTLAEAGIPVSVLVAPVVPGLTDHGIEDLLRSAYAVGAREAGYVLLRLPRDREETMRAWLDRHTPDRTARVLSLVEGAQGGRPRDAAGDRLGTGVGPYAWMVGRRFEAACAGLGLNRRRLELRTDLFAVPGREVGQLSLL